MNSAMAPVVLVVEDNEDDLFILKRAFCLAKVALELRHVEDGQQAIDYLRGVGPYFDRVAFPLPPLILLDLKLPLKNGFEVLEWIRQSPTSKRTVVVILTSSDDDRDVAKAYDSGANAFLVKPPSVEKLTELVGAVETFWLKHNKFTAQAD